MQIAIQNQIEALQQQQQHILQQQIASNQVMGSAFATPQLGGASGGGLRQPIPSGAAAAAAGHRRIQSTQAMMGQFGASGFSMPGGVGSYGMPGMGMTNLDASGALGLGLGAAPGVRGQHGRRHSMNVINRNAGSIGGDISGSPNFGVSNLEGFDDGFAPAGGGGHSRQPSRADPTWRNSS